MPAEIVIHFLMTAINLKYRRLTDGRGAEDAGVQADRNFLFHAAIVLFRVKISYNGFTRRFIKISKCELNSHQTGVLTCIIMFANYEL
jgi:hypothetical protein